MDQSVLHRLDIDAPALGARVNHYAGVHKGLRLFMGETLAAVGRTDPADATEVAATLAQVRDLLAVCASHLAHENHFIHAAMEARRPGSSAHTADDHVGHEASIAALRAAVEAVEVAPGERRTAGLSRLYAGLARFVAENLEHMQVEETHNMAVLWDAYDDDELEALVQTLLASIPPQESMMFNRWILAGVSHPERVGMLTSMRAGAPAEVFAAVLDLARATLAQRDWAKLARALDVPAVPGWVERW